MRERKRIIIIGAGFGGITATLKLAKHIRQFLNEYEIILIDRHHHQLYTPALYEIASIPREYTSDTTLKSSVLIPISDIVGKRQITFVCDEFVGLKKEERKILLKNGGVMTYAYLVLALGAETNYFGIPGLAEKSFPLKTFDDTLRLRNAIEDAVEKKDSIRIVVGGAGTSGVELVAEFVNFVCALQREKRKDQKTCSVQFMLVEATPEILSGFHPTVVARTRKRLERLGIIIRTNTPIASVEEGELTFKSGEKEPYDIFIWTGGVKGPEIFEHTGIPTSKKGAALIDEYLRVQQSDGSIFAIGDNSTFVNPKTGQPIVWNVPVAEAEGRLVAKNIIRAISGAQLKKYVPMRRYPFILTVGRKYAIADFVFIRFWGFMGWCAKHLVELRYLLFILPLRKALTTWLKGVKIFSAND